MFTPVHQAWLESSMDAPDAPLQPPSTQPLSISPVPFPQLDDEPIHGIIINYVMDRTALESAFGSSITTPLYDKIDALADLVFESKDIGAIQDAFASMAECANTLSSTRSRRVRDALTILRASFDHLYEWYHTLSSIERHAVAVYYYGED